jgi:hypothetical protein
MARRPLGGEGSCSSAALRLRLPRAADIRVLRDGLPCHAVRSDRLDIAAETSRAYRVEARIGDRLWLLSNAVHLQAPEKAR